jgi:arylsulfatase A-like enzyme
MAAAGRDGGVWIVLAVLGLWPSDSIGSNTRPNVLFIAVDDLRPALGCYGDKLAKTPHVDRLAATGVTFDRAYCQEAVCSPSRTSLLTGRRPDTTRVHDLTTHFRTTIPDVVTLPQHFKQHGYQVQGFGKVFHACFPSPAAGHDMDDPPSWSAAWWGPQPHYYHTPAGIASARRWFAERYKTSGADVDRWVDHVVRGPAWESPDVADEALFDARTTSRAIEALRQIGDRPFFLAVGFVRPHLPFVAPKHCFDRHPLDAIPLPANRRAPRDAPAVALNHYVELSAYDGMNRTHGGESDDVARRLIQGYYACVSHVDDQIGRLLDELERLQLHNRTVVVLWSDHGFHLGENGLWAKGTNFELSTRVPLIVSVPGLPTAGRNSPGLVELVDVYPTLVDACGLPMPEGLEGTSFRPLLDDPDRPWKSAAFSQYAHRVSPSGQIQMKRGGSTNVTGYSLRTVDFRFTEWSLPDHEFYEAELYDHRTDPQENRNVAAAPAYTADVERLRRQLHAGWQAARPSLPE